VLVRGTRPAPHRRQAAPPSAAAAAAAATTATSAAGRADADDAPATDDDDDTTSSSDDSDDSASVTASDTTPSEFSDFSVDCTRCNRHISRGGNGLRCTDDRCRATVCTTCTPQPGSEPDWWCPVHADTLAFAPTATAAKGRSAVRRFAEFVDDMPQRLATAKPSHDIIDLVLASYVNARCGVARKRPRAWGTLPERSTVRGEVAAVVGLLRLADLLPDDPRGSLPKMRRTLRKCKCGQKHDASPRAYTFLWELETAWRISIDRKDPRQCMVWAMCIIAVYFLLRPRYARLCAMAELVVTSPRSAELKWQRDDKGRPIGRPAGAPGLTLVPQTGLPARHPRLTAASGDVLATAINIISRLAPPRRGDQPVFPRVEIARQTRVVPTGAVLHDWVPPGGGEPVPAFWWRDSPMTSSQWSRNMRTFLTPIIGPTAARARVPSGLRGGGEMELVELGASVAMRATQGWWRAKRLSAEGALITYEGCSTETMCEETSFLGSSYIRVRAPGVYTVTPPPAAWRAARCRAVSLRLYCAVRSRQGERERYFARKRAAALAAPHQVRAGAGGK